MRIATRIPSHWAAPFIPRMPNNRPPRLRRQPPGTGSSLIEVAVRPVGAESESKTISSNLDGGIEKNFKAALVAKGLDKQHIRFDAKNGVLTLKGRVDSPAQRQEAQQVAASVPNVRQVLNEIEVKR